MNKWTKRLAVAIVALAMLFAAQPAMAEETGNDFGLGALLEKYGGANGLAQALASQGLGSEETQALLIAVQRTMQANDLADRTDNQLTAQQINDLASQAETESVLELLQIAQQMAQAARNQAREQRDQELNGQTRSLMEAAEATRQAAQTRLQATVTSGITQNAMGAGYVNKIAPPKVPVSGALNPDAGGQWPSFADQPMADNRPSADNEAAEARARAEREVSEQALEQASDLMNQMLELIRDIREKLGAIEQERVETNRGIARNI